MKRWKQNLSVIAIFLLGAAIVGRLAILQIVKHDIYKAWAKGQQNVFGYEVGERGRIFFKNGEVLATNVKGKSIYIKPLEVKDKKSVATGLSEILKLSEDTLMQKIESGKELQKIKTALTESEIEEIKNKNLEGVYISEENAESRRYPQGEMASQLVGFVGGDGDGQYGVEGYYNETVKGKESYSKNNISINGILGLEDDSIDGSDLYLTIDYNIQRKAEELLKKSEGSLKFQSGQIIVAEPKTGKILALANWPNFNPNNYSEVKDYSVFQNSALQKLYEPGSVFKPLTMAAALDQNKITPETRYFDNGVIQVGSYSIYNYDHRSYGERNMTEVLERSINTGAVFAQRQLGNELFKEYVAKFGFFEPTGIDLQGETASENNEFKKGYEINFCTAAFGQGLEITPIQLVRAFTAIANDGYAAKPYVVEKIVRGGKVEEIKPEISPNRIVSSKAANDVRNMMASVIENGFSKKAKIPGYYISGKTGTAQIAYSSLGISRRGYSDKTWQSFIGITPSQNSRFVALVKLDSPEIPTAEYSAMPIFKELAQYIIDYLKIPPDYEVEIK